MEFKYLTTTPPIGGRIKQICDDFLVEEIGKDYNTKITYLPDKRVEVDWNQVYENKKDLKYLLVDMEKYNMSTTSAINDVSRYLRISKKKIGYAGLKDKRAITCQKISISDPPKERIEKFYYKNVKIYNPIWSNKEITIGDLEKNKFTMTVRNIKDKTKEDLEKLFLNFKEEIETYGIINYFGEQRFGGVRSITDKVGKLLLKRQYKEAVLLYLTETSPLEKEEIKNARLDLKENMDFGKSAANFPVKDGYERQMLNHLAKYPTDFLGAIKVLPISIQYLFIHAYQAYLFNELLNERINRGFTLNKIDDDKINNNGEVVYPLFGYESSFSSGVLGEIQRDLFEKENINISEFFNKDHSVLSSKGEFREIKVFAYDLSLINIEEDDLNLDSLKLTFSFVLDKGNYATNIARELIKPKEMHGWY